MLKHMGQLSTGMLSECHSLNILTGNDSIHPIIELFKQIFYCLTRVFFLLISLTIVVSVCIWSLGMLQLKRLRKMSQLFLV